MMVLRIEMHIDTAFSLLCCTSAKLLKTVFYSHHFNFANFKSTKQ